MAMKVKLSTNQSVFFFMLHLSLNVLSYFLFPSLFQKYSKIKTVLHSIQIQKMIKIM